MQSCSSAALARFLNLSIKCHKLETTATIVKNWVERLWNKSIPSTPAIFATHRNLQDLKGPAYYAHLLDMHDRRGSPTAYGATHFRMDEKLNTNAPTSASWADTSPSSTTSGNVCAVNPLSCLLWARAVPLSPHQMALNLQSRQRRTQSASQHRNGAAFTKVRR